MRQSSVAYGGASALFRLWGTAFLALFLALVIAIPQAEAARRKRHKAAPYAPPYASIVYDVNTGRVLQATNADAARHPASVTKVMTLYMLFEQIERGRFRLDSELPVSRFAASQKPSKLNLRAGSTISVEDAIKALVTKSANDVAVVVAEAIGGTEERFGQMMTAKARAIGMTRSTFRNASGLPNPQQITTARDLVTLGRAIHDRFPKFYPYFGTRSFEYDGYAYRNHNKLLGRVEGVDGIKTGYTRASGFNLLTSAKVDGRHIIAVVLGGRSGRQRDVQVAALVEEHMPRAVAGRRTPRNVEIAANAFDDNDDDETEARPAQRAIAAPAPRLAENPSARLAQNSSPAPAAGQNEALPLPPARPRAAVIGDTADQGLTRSRGLALGVATPVGGSATTPLALLSPQANAPASRAVQSADALPPSRESRVVPPGDVRFTNALPTTPAAAEDRQPLPPAIEGPSGRKAEERVPSPIASPAGSTTATASPTTTPAPKAANRPGRTGWVVQLGATDSEAKARGILDDARGKNARLLRGAEPFTETVNRDGTIFYRARFAGFEAEEAQEACKALKRNGFNCFAQRL